MKLFQRLFLLALLFCGVLPSAINTLADISGSSTTVQLSTSPNTVCKWIQVIAPPGNANAVRFGDSTTSPTKGLPIAPGGGYNTPSCDTCVYPLSAAYVYVVSGDKASVACGN